MCACEQPDPNGPFATALRVATDLCSPLTGAIMGKMAELERNRPDPSTCIDAPEIADAGPHLRLQVEDSAGLAAPGTELSFPVAQIGSDVGELMRRVCDELSVGRGLGASQSHATPSQLCMLGPWPGSHPLLAADLAVRVCVGEDFGWSFYKGTLVPNHSLHFEVFDVAHGEWFTPDDLDEIEDLDQALRLRLRPAA